MKQAVSLGVLASLFLVCTSFAPVSAEPPAPSPIGEWGFKTSTMNEGCTLSGSMTITRKADKTMACTFKAVWACKQVVPRSVETDQTCTAKQTGSTVTITSKIAPSMQAAIRRSIVSTPVVLSRPGSPPG